MLTAAGCLLICEKNDPVIGLILGQRGGQRVSAVDLVEHQAAPAQTARIQLPFCPGRRSHCLESPCLETVALSLTTDYGLRTADCGRIEVIERDIQRRGRVRQGADADTV